MHNKKTEEQKEQQRETEELRKQRIFVKYLKDCVEFARLVQKALPLVVQLLSSKLISDVLEAIKFFITGMFEKLFARDKDSHTVNSHSTVIVFVY